MCFMHPGMMKSKKIVEKNIILLYNLEIIHIMGQKFISGILK